MKTRFVNIFLVIAAFLFPTGLNAQNYLWPTNASTYLSSSFCEFREGHYHSGIDIKTWLNEGFPCYAIENGRIERIRISPFGYGKVLYLRLDDGNIAVYAHLQRFTKTLDQIIRKKQLQNQRYTLNWYPKKIYVKKGEIIAYTGRTGTGVPHLHFEIRNNKHRPINPLTYYQQVKDTRRPRLESVAVIPISQNATINGSLLPEIFDLTHLKGGIYVIKNPLRVKGRIGIAVNGYDQADYVSNKYGFYQTTMEVDTKSVFDLTYTELNFSTTMHIYTETHYPLWIDTGTIFHKLYVEKFNPLPFYRRFRTSDGTIQIYDKPISFTIIIRDYHNNQSIIKGEFVPDKSAVISVDHVKREKDWAYVKFYSPPLKEVQFLTGSDNDQLFFPVKYFEIIEGKIGNPAESIFAKINVQDTTHNLLKISINSNESEESQKILALVDINQPLDHQIHFAGKKLILEYTNLYVKDSQLRVLLNSNPIFINYLYNGNAQALISSKMIESDQIELQLFADQKLLWSDSLEIATIYPDIDFNRSWFDSAFVIKAKKGTVLDTTLITSYCYFQDTSDTSLPILDRVYEIHPHNIPLFNNISINIKADSLPPWGNWAIFKMDADNSLSYLNTSYDPNKRILQAESSELGKFVLACDTIPPKMEIISPLPGEIYSKNPAIKINIYDEHAGIGDEENISVLLDGIFVLPEWDPEDEFVEARVDYELKSGNHTLTVSLTDRCGNSSRKAIYFTVR
jgi:hypothetical protein